MRAERSAAAVLVAALAAPLSACPATGNDYLATSGGRRTAASAGAGATTAATGATSGTTGGSSSGATGGSTGTTGTQGSTTGTSCPAQPDSQLTDCGDGGLLEIRGFLVDATAALFGVRAKPIQASIQFSDLSDPAGTSHSDPCGQVFFCEPPGHILAMFVNSDGYTPLITQDMDIQVSLFFSLGFPVFSAATLPTFVASLNPPFDVAEASVVVSVDNPSGCNPAGWTFTLDAGGTILQPATAYVVGSTFENQATETGADGVALLYNLGSFTGDVSVIGAEDPSTYGSAGPCYPLIGKNEYNGNTHLQSGAIANFLYAVQLDAG